MGQGWEGLGRGEERKQCNYILFKILITKGSYTKKKEGAERERKKGGRKEEKKKELYGQQTYGGKMPTTNLRETRGFLPQLGWRE